MGSDSGRDSGITSSCLVPWLSRKELSFSTKGSLSLFMTNFQSNLPIIVDRAGVNVAIYHDLSTVTKLTKNSFLLTLIVEYLKNSQSDSYRSSLCFAKLMCLVNVSCNLMIF